MKEPQVVVLGDANTDMIVRLPDRSATNDIHQQHLAPELHGGGTAANVAVALARLGVPTSFAGAIGADNYGRWVHDDLIEEGVDLRGVHMVEDAFTVMVMALIEPDGERLIYVWPPSGGAHLHLHQKDIDLNVWPKARWLHTSGICLRGNPARETILNSMEKAHALGWKVSIDLNMRMESWGLDIDDRQAFEHAIEISDVVFGNAIEEIMPISGQSSVEKAVKNLSNNNRTIVARIGDDGAMVCTPNELFHAPVFPAKVVDTLGAGDAFNAGFITAQLKGLDTREAARWGNAVAALKIEHKGARGLPNMTELSSKLQV